MNSPELRAIGSIDIFHLFVIEEIDSPCVAEAVVFYQINVMIDVALQCPVRIVIVFVAVCTAIIEVRSPGIGQMLLGIVLNGFELIAVAGDFEIVYESVVV